MRYLSVGVAIVVGLLTAALGASAAGAAAPHRLPPGVFVDPGSPAGKQYSVSLSVLRAQAGGQSSSGGSNSSQTTTPPPFGVGVTRPAANSGSSIPNQNGGSRNHNGGSSRNTGGQSGAARAQSGAGRSGAGSSSAKREKQAELVVARIARPGSAVPTTALLASLVLGLGLAFGAGLGWARRR